MVAASRIITLWDIRLPRIRYGHAAILTSRVVPLSTSMAPYGGGERGPPEEERRVLTVGVTGNIPNPRTRGSGNRAVLGVRGDVSWSARATATISLVLFVGLVTIATDQLTGFLEVPSDIPLRSSLIIDSMALGCGLLSFAALGAKHRAVPDRLNLLTGTMVGIVTFLSLPLDLLGGMLDLPVIGSLTTTTRFSLLALPLALRFTSVGHTRQALGRFSIKWLVGTTAAGLSVGVALPRLAGDPSDVLRHANMASAMLLLLGACGIGVWALRTSSPRAYALALMMIAIAVADAPASLVDPASLTTPIGKATRLVTIAAMLFYTVDELRVAALREAERAVAAESESEQATQRLLAQVAVQQRFVHDTRNALLAIQGGLNSIGDDTSGPMVGALSSEVNRLRTLLREDVLPVQFDVAKALVPMATCYRAAGHELVLSSTGSAIARAVPAVAVEVAQNLIENAIRHGGGGAIHIWVFGSDDAVEVRIADRGTGVDEQLREVIFERGYTSGSGHGLGLSISQRLIESQGGTMNVTDRFGGGSIFSFCLPRASTRTEIDLRDRAAM